LFDTGIGWKIPIAVSRSRIKEQRFIARNKIGQQTFLGFDRRSPEEIFRNLIELSVIPPLIVGESIGFMITGKSLTAKIGRFGADTGVEQSLEAEFGQFAETFNVASDLNVLV